AEPHQHVRHGTTVAIIIATFITPVIWWLGHLLPSDQSFEVPRPALLYFKVLLISAAITVIKRVLPLPSNISARAPEKQGETARLPRLAQRLENGENSVILRLTVRDHF